MAVDAISWEEHAVLYSLHSRGRKSLMSGRLHVLVDVALSFLGGVGATMIETDSGKMFCRQEIGYIAMDPGRPRS